MSALRSANLPAGDPADVIALERSSRCCVCVKYATILDELATLPAAVSAMLEVCG